MLGSGGSELRPNVYYNTTVEIEEEGRREKKRNLLMEQKLANHMWVGKHMEVLEIALRIKKPMQALKVLVTLLEGDLKGRSQAFDILHYHVKR